MTTVPGNTKGESITILLTSCLTGLELSVLQIKTNIVSCHTDDSKPVKQQVNSTVILPPLVFPACTNVMVSRGVIDDSRSIIDDYRSIIESRSKLWRHSLMTLKASFMIVIFY